MKRSMEGSLKGIESSFEEIDEAEMAHH